MDDKEAIGYCAECGNVIYNDEEAYIDADGNYLCSVECVLEYHEITKVGA